MVRLPSASKKPEEYERISPLSELEAEPLVSRRSTRERHVPERYGFKARHIIEHALACAASVLHEPKNHEEAIMSPDAEKWVKTEQEKLKALVSAGAWIEVDRPKGQSVVSCKWVYKIKQSADETIERYKTRLVARGFT